MQDGQAEFLPLDYKAMRRNRGECLLASCAAVGCMFVVAGAVLVVLYTYFRPRPSDVRPMVHQTPARSVEIRSGGSRSGGGGGGCACAGCACACACAGGGR